MSDYTMLRHAYLRGVARAIDEDTTEKTAGIGSGLFNLGRFALTGGGQLAQKGGRIAKFMSPMMFGGTLGGALNVMGGDNEQPWYTRFGKGYLGGMAGGLGAAVATRGVVKGLGALGKGGLMQKYAPNLGNRLAQGMTGGTGMAGRQTLGNIFSATKPLAGATRNWGDTAKRLGVWGLAGVPVAGAMMAGDTVASDIANKAMAGQPPALSPGAGAMGVAGRGFADQYMTPQYWGRR